MLQIKDDIVDSSINTLIQVGEYQNQNDKALENVYQIVLDIDSYRDYDLEDYQPILKSLNRKTYDIFFNSLQSNFITYLNDKIEDDNIIDGVIISGNI